MTIAYTAILTILDANHVVTGSNPVAPLKGGYSKALNINSGLKIYNRFYLIRLVICGDWCNGSTQ